QDGRHASAAALADTSMMTCCALCYPTHAIRKGLAVSAPATAPIVFAAYTPPTRRPASRPGVATLASASGKAAPHRIPGGSRAHNARTRASLKSHQTLDEDAGQMAQYGTHD